MELGMRMMMIIIITIIMMTMAMTTTMFSYEDQCEAQIRIPRITGLQFTQPPHSRSQEAYEVGSLVKVVTIRCGLCT